jgi:glutamate synthase domain-containing protein 2
MGNDKGYRVYWDHLVLNASQVTNPSIDPLREPMELATYLGRKPDKVEIDPKTLSLKTELAPQVKIDVPVMFAAMSYGAVSLNVHESLARAATEAGTLWNTGEGGLHPKLYKYGANTIVQVASGRFGVHQEYLDAAAVVEIKIGQGAKPGIGGHLPGEKISAEVSMTRMIPKGTDALSPAPQHDIYSIEDLAQLVHALKEATNYTKPISVKIAAVHNSAAIASGMVRAGADIIVLDGLRGSTGAAPKIIRDHVGIPIEMALASVDSRLRQEGIRNQASLIISGGIRNSADVAKAIALGADAVYIGTAALVALGCTICQKCYTGKCAWGICTTDLALTKRINPDIGARRLANLLRGWSLELKDILGGMGVNALESLRGNRLHLRGIGLTDTELEILGVRMAGN